MRYAEFRNRLENALREVGLFVHDADRVETINLADTVRHWRAYIRRSAPPSAEPFSVSAEISFRWTPFDAARSYTCEEDLYLQLVGRRRQPTRTARRWTRVDLSLYANLPYGSTTSMPEPACSLLGLLLLWRRLMQPLARSRRGTATSWPSLARTGISRWKSVANRMALFL